MSERVRNVGNGVGDRGVTPEGDVEGLEGGPGDAGGAEVGAGSSGSRGVRRGKPARLKLKRSAESILLSTPRAAREQSLEWLKRVVEDLHPTQEGQPSHPLDRRLGDWTSRVGAESIGRRRYTLEVTDQFLLRAVVREDGVEVGELSIGNWLSQCNGYYGEGLRLLIANMPCIDDVDDYVNDIGNVYYFYDPVAAIERLESAGYTERAARIRTIVQSRPWLLTEVRSESLDGK